MYCLSGYLAKPFMESYDTSTLLIITLNLRYLTVQTDDKATPTLILH